MNMKEFYVYVHRRNDTNEVFYVGKGKLRRAWSRGSRNNWWKHIVDKHGYTVEIVEYFDTEQESFDGEQLLISQHRNNGAQLVNLTDGGEGSSGREVSEETRAKIAMKARGRKASEETKAKLSAKMKGRKPSVTTLEKLRIASTGRIKSEEERAKIAEKAKGRKASEETKAKLSEVMRGRTHSEETKAKLRGKIMSEEARAKIAASKIGKPRSEETKAKLSEATRGEKHHLFGKHLAEETKVKMSEISITNKYIQIDMADGNVIAEYIGKRALIENGFDPSSVIKASTGKTKFHKGFFWRIEKIK